MNARKRTALFVLIAYGASWGIGFFAMAQGITLDGLLADGQLTAGQLLSMGLLAFYMWMPALAAFFTCAITGQGLRTVTTRLRLKKDSLRWCLAGWAAPFLAAAVGAGTYFLFFPERFDGLAHLRVALTSVTGSGLPAAVLLLGLIFLLAAAVPFSALLSGPLGEEIGWRGYLYPALCRWMPRWRAMLVSGMIWGVWHTPLLIMGWDYGTGYWGYPIGGIAVLTLCLVCLGAFQCWLTDRSGSIWPCTLLHSALNLIFSAFFLGNNFCAGPYHPLIGSHPLTLLGGWVVLAAGWVVLVKTHAQPPEEAPSALD